MKKKEKQIKQPKQEKKGFQFADWDYDTISGSIPNLPASWLGFWAWRIKRMFLGLKLSKSAFLLLLKALLAFVAVSVASYYFNIFFWAWLNDSMWIGWGKGYGNVAGFLIPGGAFNTGNGIIGLEPLAVFLNLFFKQGSNYSVPNGWLAWPFTLAVGCLVTYLISNILTRGLTGVLRDMAGIPVYLHHYAGRGSKKLWKFLLEGVFYATVIGFVVVNPFAVPLLGVYILLCFGQEADNPRVIGLFLRRCRLYKKAEKGGGKTGEKPLLADTMLQIFSLGLGFFVYSLLNLLVWNLFAYHFFARLIFSLLLAAMTLTLSGGARRKKLGKAMGMMAITTGVLALRHVTAFAHDGGASESGGTWTGLTRNAGFKDMDASSKLGVAGMNIGAAHATRLVNYADILMDSKTRLTATDQFILDRMFNMYDRYYRGEPVSMDEFNSLRDLYIKNLNGQLSDDVNYQRTWAQGFWEDTGTAFSNGFRELVEGQTVNSAIARVPLGVATMGYSEMAIAPFGAAYDAYSRVQSGNTNAWSVWSDTMGNQIFNLAVGEACGAGVGQAMSGSFRAMSGASGAVRSLQSTAANWMSSARNNVSRSTASFVNSVAHSMESMANSVSQMGRYAEVSTGGENIFRQSRAAQSLRDSSPMHSQAAWDQGVVHAMSETASGTASTAASGAVGGAAAPYMSGGSSPASGTSAGSSASGGSSGSDGTLWGARQQFASEFGF
ncbi:MAG TPA: hypothetical protein H9770_09620 [Candidatus Fournierella excrementigallinarum]|nr:hypothetical protein [Candidatus Fournierella excrementigallinarum]